MFNKPLLGLTVAAMLMVQMVCVAFHWRSIERGNVDFAALFQTARLIREGGVPNYDPTQARAHRGDESKASDSTPKQFAPADTLHPPFEAFIFLPLTFFPYITAYVVWTVCNLAMLWLVPIVLRDHLSRLLPEASLVASLFGSAFPVLICIMFGQDSIFLLLLMSLAFSSIIRGHQIRGGLLFAIGLFKFHLVLPIIVAFFAMRFWKVIMGFIVGALAILTSSLAVVGLRASMNYARSIFTTTQQISIQASEKTAYMANLRGLISEIVGPYTHPEIQSIVTLILSVAFLIAMVIWNDHFRTLSLSIRFSLAVNVTSVISYHYFIHNAVILLIPVLLMANEFANPNSDGALRSLFYISIIGSYLMPVLALFGIISLEVGTAGFTVGSIGLLVTIFALPFRDKYLSRPVGPEIPTRTSRSFSSSTSIHN